MCFSESDIEKRFNSALATSSSFLDLKSISLAEIDRRNARVIKGQNFLKSIKELKKLCEQDKNSFYHGFLETAIQTLENPSEENYKLLYICSSRLKAYFKDPSEHSKVTCGYNIFVHSLHVIAGAAGVLLGTFGIASAILGTVTLSMGPWGLAALSLVFVIASAIVFALEFYKLCLNIRFVADSQLNEISDFVEFLKPSSFKEEMLSLETPSNLVEIANPTNLTFQPF